jgi:enterochelin esterase-like enzyme
MEEEATPIEETASAALPPSTYRAEKLTGIYTKILHRHVEVEIFTPVTLDPAKKYPLLVLNDGQDSEAVKLKATLERLTSEEVIPEIIVAGVTAGNRMQEYGVAFRHDYHGRGSLAKAYAEYITKELVPYLNYRYPLTSDPAQRAMAGYSLGGLSAIDIVWNHSDLFGKAGIFSGSFWWRKRDSGSFFYSDHRDRLMHLQVRRGKFKPGLKFWFQAGTRDEDNDRNHNGVIDSIDDTMDLISELTKKGYRPFHDIQYLEIKDGLHHPDTWGQAMPHFLTWAFGPR